MCKSTLILVNCTPLPSWSKIRRVRQIDGLSAIGLEVASYLIKLFSDDFLLVVFILDSFDFTELP